MSTPLSAEVVLGHVHDALIRANRVLDALPVQDFPSHSLSLGVLLAQAHVTQLLPRLRFSTAEENGDGTDLRHLVELLRAAEEQTRDLPADHPRLPGISDLVVELCDLVREAEALALT